MSIEGAEKPKRNLQVSALICFGARSFERTCCYGRYHSPLETVKVGAQKLKLEMD